MNAKEIELDIFGSKPIAQMLAEVPDLWGRIGEAHLVRREGYKDRHVIDKFIPSLWDHTVDLWKAVKLLPWSAYGIDKEGKELAEKLAFVHDLLVEIPPGRDITPNLGLTRQEKEAEERHTKTIVVASLGPGNEGVGEFWEIYQAKIRPVAKIVGQLDKVVGAVEAQKLVWANVPVEEGYPPLCAKEFFVTANECIADPFIKSINSKMESHYHHGYDPNGIFENLLQSHSDFKRAEKYNTDQIFYRTIGPAPKLPNYA